MFPKFGKEDANLETRASCVSEVEGCSALNAFSACTRIKTLPMMWSGWLDVVWVMLLMLLNTRSCSLVLADQPLINLFWIGACAVMWK